jgi:glycosyltransferase involved in cell wall biosynthesis
MVVAVYNGETTLHECLAALARLRYPDYEVIVVDDGSKDASAAISGGIKYAAFTCPTAA